MLRPGDSFADYVVERILGRGGNAMVYLAHRQSEPGVALKILTDDHRDPAAIERLHREFEIARGLQHPHIAAMFDHGPTWLAMQYVDGGSVAALASLADKLSALAQVAEALDYVHHNGVVHCDVKPTNILVAKSFLDVGAVLIDFGVAHVMGEQSPPVAARPSHVQASLPYAAPELLTGSTPSPATDEYELACTAVELIAGAPPFTAATPMGLFDRHLHHPPPRLSYRIDWVPRAFDSILAKAMAKRPESRYQTCTEFVRLITRALT
ncbi:serine/threonine-protein kinase [Mycolicibacterium rhodesiae]|uniref:non-specific serine/threonine protein kinase n=1 Tax=Mycolicibacterium rhodesiae TaxID=36814 RepID=A0A1X0J1Q3_MYCRH|nr:serine/threonine-protein kinase [Mycolicibacterium rhodesiae]MCV7345328.1 serine/threonine protein kinase [Mycolicibacterium rhodesiae]ORB54945.1 serine/threonine protein kinase [Mycolicibacterium rhodesiae]